MLKTWLDSGVITWENIYGICVLNEPFAIPGKRDDIWIALRDDFYPKAYDAIRKHLDDRVFVNYQSAFRAISDFNGHFNNLSSVSIDQHLYQCFWDWCKVATRPKKEMYQVGHRRMEKLIIDIVKDQATPNKLSSDLHSNLQIPNNQAQWV